jgi:ABC-type Mn2+/Zn2+ transport system permease subunit
VTDFLSPDFLFRNALLGGLVVCALCGALGVYVVLRRLVLLGVALPQAGAAGVAAVFFASGHAHSDASAHGLALLGSFAATLGALAALVSRGARTPVEWRIGGVLAVASAATLLFVALHPTGDLEMTSLLRGELLAIADADLVALFAFALAATALFALFRRGILLASFDPEFARTLRLDPRRYDAVLYLVLGATIALGVMTVGPLVVFAFLVLPALAALRLAPSLAGALVLGAVLGAVISVGGFWVAYHADLPAGPVDVVLAALAWVAAEALARVGARVRAAVLALALVGAALSTSGCISPADGAPARAAFPQIDAGTPVAVLSVRNDTGDPLPLRSGNAPRDLGAPSDSAAAGRVRTVPQALAELVHRDLARRGVPVLARASVERAIPKAPADAASAAAAARRAGLRGPLLYTRLERFSVSRESFLVAWLDFALVDVETGATVWSASARRTLPVRGAATLREVVADAAPALLEDAFGPP